MHPDVEQYIKDNPQYFEMAPKENKPFYYVDDFISITRSFQLFLANRTERTLATPLGDMGRCEALQVLGSNCWVRWVTPSGDARNGQATDIEYPTPAMCNCPMSSSCSKKVGILLDIQVKSFIGSPAKTAKLCLWHENRDKFQFCMYFLGETNFPITLFNNPEVKKALDEFTNTTQVFNYDKDSLKLIYEQNKNSMTCVGCGKPTYERPLFFTTIRYCDCIERK